LGNEGAAGVLDRLKQLGFEYATKSGVSIAMDDIEESPDRSSFLKKPMRKLALLRINLTMA